MTKSTKQNAGVNLPPVASATTVSAPKRGRGRPRKNPAPQAVPTADPIMEMVASYRDIQNQIKTLNDQLAPIKDALTRHLIAGEEDKIVLADGSYMVSKVMKTRWVYSDKLEEQRIDLKAAEEKEQLNGKASATFTAHVRGSAK